MYEKTLVVNMEEQESDLYDDLSQLIKVFKRILTLSNDIIHNLNAEPTIHS